MLKQEGLKHGNFYTAAKDHCRFPWFIFRRKRTWRADETVIIPTGIPVLMRATFSVVLCMLFISQLKEILPQNGAFLTVLYSNVAIRFIRPLNRMWCNEQQFINYSVISIATSSYVSLACHFGIFGLNCNNPLWWIKAVPFEILDKIIHTPSIWPQPCFFFDYILKKLIAHQIQCFVLTFGPCWYICIIVVN